MCHGVGVIDTFSRFPRLPPQGLSCHLRTVMVEVPPFHVPACLKPPAGLPHPLPHRGRGPQPGLHPHRGRPSRREPPKRRGVKLTTRHLELVRPGERGSDSSGRIPTTLAHWKRDVEETSVWRQERHPEGLGRQTKSQILRATSFCWLMNGIRSNRVSPPDCCRHAVRRVDGRTQCTPTRSTEPAVAVP